MTLANIVVGFTLWLVLGYVVAMLICPILKDPADMETTMSPEKLHELGASASHFRTTGESYLN
jgi:hypothetical protein